MYQEKIDRYFADPQVRAQLIGAVSRLVAVKSVKGEAQPDAPFGPGPRAALDEAVKLCSELGFESRNYDNYVGLCDLNDKPTQLHILGHLDVVGEGKGWDTDPYTCVEKDGMLYGRGVSDDKGPVCAALFALKAIKDLGIPVSKNARLIMGTDEESGSQDIAYYYSKEPFAPQAFTPDADFPCINIEKGHFGPTFGAQWAPETCMPRVTAMTGGFRSNVVPPEAQAQLTGIDKQAVEPLCVEVSQRTGAVFTVTTIPTGIQIHCAGKNAHAAMPEGGINAIQALLEVLSALPLAQCPSTNAVRALNKLFPFGDLWGKAAGIAQEDESGPLTLNLAIITLTGAGFTAKIDSRVPVCATRENCADVLRASLAAHGLEITEGSDRMMDAHIVPADSPLVRTLLRSYEAVTGVTDAKPIAIGGGTYVHHIPGGVAFGCEFPGFDSKMHSANEQNSVENLLKSARIFALAIAELCR